jgi:hypothetical protein
MREIISDGDTKRYENILLISSYQMIHIHARMYLFVNIYTRHETAALGINPRTCKVANGQKNGNAVSFLFPPKCSKADVF